MEAAKVAEQVSGAAINTDEWSDGETATIRLYTDRGDKRSRRGFGGEKGFQVMGGGENYSPELHRSFIPNIT